VELAIIDTVWEGSSLEGAPGWAKAREIGFDAIDVAFDPVGKQTAEVAKYVADVQDNGLPVRSAICVSLGIGGDYNSSVQQFHVDRAKRHLELAAEIGARNLLLVIGEYIWQNEIIPAADQWAATVQNVREVARHAHALELKLALELEHWRYAFLNSIPAAVTFIDEVAVDACKLNLDLNHLWAMKATSDQIQLLKDKISHAHISDCHGVVYENLPPGRGTAPLRDYLAALVSTGYDATLSVELAAPPPKEDADTWVREAYRKTIALMDATGARATSVVADGRPTPASSSPPRVGRG
jgi:D-psicose/D-tagatose/L-ribulose 3-epimerase